LLRVLGGSVAFNHLMKENGMPTKIVVVKESPTHYKLKSGGANIASVSAHDDGWRVQSLGCGRTNSRKAWPTPGEAVFAFFRNTGVARARALKEELEAARLPYEVIDLNDHSSHGDYPTVDEARGCVEFDRLKSYQIWYRGTRIVECQEAA
jgi:hypothetical protein